MRRFHTVVLLGTLLSFICGHSLFVMAATPSLNLPLNQPSLGYQVSPLWSNLTFDQPVSVHAAPGETNRLFVLERTGNIMVVTNLAQPEKSLFLDLSTKVMWESEGDEAGLLGMVFHPGFVTNRQVYVYYTTMTDGYAGYSFYDRLSRFTISTTNPHEADPQSELIILQQQDGHSHHNAGDMFFGEDGYLYLSLGDEGGGLEPQNIDKDLFSGIIRIDVDKRPGNLPPNPHPAITENYLIPQDNPFIGISEFNKRPIDPRKVRTEFFVVGTRNPWRISHDQQTGLIYGSDVGDRGFEEINLYVPGGNYGWFAYEGDAYNTKLQPHHTNMVHFKPLGLYGRAEGNAILASLVYRGDRYAKLKGKYLFSDLGTRRFGSINLLSDQTVTNITELMERLHSFRRQLQNQAFPDSFSSWENAMRSDWQTLTFDSLVSSAGGSFTVLGDRSILASGTPGWTDIYTLGAVPRIPNVTALRIEALPDPSLPNGGPGRFPHAPNEGMFVLSKLRVFANQTAGIALQEILLQYGKASFENYPDIFGALGSLDEDPASGWNIKPQTNQSNYAIFLFKEPVAMEELKVVLEQQHGAYSLLGRFRISVTTNTFADLLVAPYTIQAILDKSAGERTEAEQLQLLEYYKGIAPETKELRESIREKSIELASMIESNRQAITWFAEGVIAPSFFLHPGTGAILFPDLGDGRIKTLIQVDAPNDPPIPTQLSGVGAFLDLPSMTPATNLFAYEINHPFWSDHAIKSRWVSLPVGGKMTAIADQPWSFPAGTVFVKHFELEMEKGDAASRKKLETRFLVLAEDSAYGVTYRWNEAQTEASLVTMEGETGSYNIQEGDTQRAQQWAFPSRSDCMRCHTPLTKFVLGFNTFQLNCPVGTPATNQLRILAQAGLLQEALPNPESLPALVSLTNTVANREYRVRSYLEANCSGCHRPGGSGRGGFDARFHSTRDQSKIIQGLLVDTLGNETNRVIYPGDLNLSVLYQRISNLGEIHMPPLATSVINDEAVELLRDWITEDLADYHPYETWAQLHFGLNNPLSAQAIDPDGDGLNNYIEYLANQDPQIEHHAWLPHIELADQKVKVTFAQLANIGMEIELTSDLLSPNWQRLDHPQNVPYWTNGGGSTELMDEVTGSAKFYRLRLHTP